MGTQKNPAASDGRTVHKVEQVWASVGQELQKQIAGRDYRSWIAPLRVFIDDEERVVLAAPNAFSRDWIRENLFADLCTLWRKEDPLQRNLTVQVYKPGARPKTNTPSRTKSAQKHPESETLPSHGKYRFDNYVVGPSNEVPWAVAKAAARGAQSRFNPLFIHGGYGLGKTHLLRAIAHQAKIHAPAKRILYLTAEEFLQKFVSALRGSQALDFKNKVRSLDLLLIDDMHFLAGKAATQEEFVHTLCSLMESGAQVVLSADRSPGEIASLDDRLRSRLAGGLVTRIAVAGFELRKQILQHQIKQMADEYKGLEFPPSVVDFLATKICASPRELLGALNMVISGTALIGKPVTLVAAEDILSDIVRTARVKVSLADIQKGTASWFSLSKDDLLSRRKTRNIVRPRQIAMYLCKELTSCSLPMIGQRFDGRDHTTVIHAVKTITRLMAEDPAFADDVEGLRRSITKIKS